ncbi:MAG: hypothetical protein ACK6DC_22490 [Planctomycetota bacterium]|jgi:hypothetical protein
MLETIRRYWIGFLVFALVLMHASIVGIIRYQASQAKKEMSCEVLLGDFIAYRTKDDPPIEMTLHAMVPQKQRMKSRQLIELNEAQVRQALEEHLRQFDGRHLADPYLTDLRSQLLDILSQMLGATSVEDVLITRIRPLGNSRSALEFVTHVPRPEPRRLVATLRSENGDDDAEGASSVHGDEGEAEPSDTPHDDSKNTAPAPKDSHSPSKGADTKTPKHTSKPSSSHGKPNAKH